MEQRMQIGGADGYIAKPVDRDVLFTGIRAVLGLGWPDACGRAGG
jgi:DNA-binding NarL/FixJ family response regulator